MLDASVLRVALEGTNEIHRFFQATRTMYDDIRFVSEYSDGMQLVLRWHGGFQGNVVHGATILELDARGFIERVVILHYPFDQVLAFAAELQLRLERDRRMPMFIQP